LSSGTLDLEQLYRKHARTVLRRVRRFFGEDDAEEVMHEVFMRAIERIDSFRGAAWRLLLRRWDDPRRATQIRHALIEG
jgi:DNA-directed RNA polymerase specialized sigma24 family protein